MLLLTRRLEESLRIGKDVEVKVLAITKGQVTLGISAPAHISIHRREVYEAICALNRLACGFHPSDLDKAQSLLSPKKKTS